MTPRDIAALRAADVRNAKEFGTPADLRAAKSAYAATRASMLREWDRLDAANTQRKATPPGNGKGPG